MLFKCNDFPSNCARTLGDVVGSLSGCACTVQLVIITSSGCGADWVTQAVSVVLPVRALGYIRVLAGRDTVSS